MNQGWKFHLGEIEYDTIRGHFMTYMHSKAQSAQNAAMPLYYDGDFETVDLPHDYVINTETSSEFNESQGGYFRDNAWYRRSFMLEESERGNRFVLLFDGAGMKTEVWVNGHFAGSNRSMYNSFEIDMTPYVLYGADINTIAVHIVNDDLEGWWYEGAGIYRNVWMIKTDKVAINTWGVYANPTKKSDTAWDLNIEATVYNMDAPTTAMLKHTVVDAKGNAVADITAEATLQFGETKVASVVEVINPTLWDLDTCVQYDVVTKVIVDGVVTDTYMTKFGFRTIEFTADHGFFLNGEVVKLRGACIHQDHSQLGVAVPVSIMEYRLRKLKEAGLNGYRCAHNNPAPEILDLCDKLGILVLDENRWFNFSETTKYEMKTMVLRDRNHPCVILWSAGNEEPLQNTLTGKELVRQMKEYMHSFDNTRPASIALNGGFFDSYAAEASDVVSVNYLIGRYDDMHKAHPDKCLIGTESGASSNNRGIYFSDKTKLDADYSSAYDLQRASFGSAYADAIRASEEHDFIAGTFMWAGIEYRGEAIWPMNISGSGILDNACIEKDNFYMVKSFWTEEPMVHIMPHWDLQGHEGETVTVNVYTNMPEVELFLNGESLGVQAVEKLHYATYEVVYTPGTIQAIARKDGEDVVVETLRTTAQATTLKVTVENTVTNSGEDAVVLQASLFDVDGYPMHAASDIITFEVDDAGTILCVDAGDPKVHGMTSCMFGGKIKAIIKVAEGATSMTVKVNAPELGLSEVVTVVPSVVEATARVAVCQSMLEVREFRIWPTTMDEKAVDASYRFSDMNTSQPITMKEYVGEAAKEGYDVYTAKTLVPKIPTEKTPYLEFHGMTGKVTVKVFHDEDCWPNPTPDEFKTLYATVDSTDKTDCLVPLVGFSANEKVNMVLHTENDGNFSLEYVHFIVK
ncbi:MAG: glycoside hydrolase family 2 TIM barrel-domain containing protein [Lachnospiraceae bacterium]